MIKKHTSSLICFCLCLLTMTSLSAQQSDPGSTFATLSLLPNDSIKAIKINELAASIARAKPTDALLYAETALALSENLAFQPGKVKAHYTLGIIALNTGQMEDALENYTEALRLCRQYALKRQNVEVLRGMSNYFRESGDSETAKNYVQQSIALARNVGDSLSVAKGMNNLAGLSSGKEQLLLYIQAATILETLTTLPNASNAEINLLSLIYSNICGEFINQNEPDKALIYAEKAIAIANKMQDIYMLIIINMQYSKIFNITGKYEQSLGYALTALDFATRSDNRGGTMANLQEVLSSIYKNMGNYPSALKHADQANLLYKNLDNIPLLARMTLETANLLLKNREPERALNKANEALNLGRTQEDFPLMAACENLSGEIHVAQKNDKQALERFLRATALIDEHALPKADFIAVYRSLADLYTRMGQGEKAVEMQAIVDILSPVSGGQ